MYNVIYSKEVKNALLNNLPVVALESTIISHGMPYPTNLEVAKKCEEIVRENGAIPATIAIINGDLVVGVDENQLEYLATSKDILKVCVDSVLDKTKIKETVNESKIVEEPKFDAKKYQNELGSKIDSLISVVKTNYAEAKEKEAAALQESKSKINSTDFNLINYIPARLQESWMKLSDERKKEILAESKMFIINGESSAVYFWNTRDLREKRINSVKMEESIVPTENKELNESVLASDSYKMMAERIKRNMRKF